MILLAVSVVVLVLGLALAVGGTRVRARALELGSTVLLDGVPHTVSVVEYAWEGAPPQYGFENLGEALARRIVFDKQSMTLGQLLVASGWQPPTPGGH